MLTRRTLLASTGLALAGTVPTARAQATSIQKPARIVLGFPPGGSLDSITRPLAEKLKGTYAPVVIVDSRPGAAGRLTMDLVKTSEPDGTTVTIVPASLMVIFPHVYKKLGYDPFKDFAAVSTVCTFQFGFSVGPQVPADVKTIQQFAAWAKANPDKAAFASAGEGTMAHFAGVMVSRAIGVDLRHVPYKGGAPAIQDVLGGHIASSINVLSEPLPFAKEGKVRVLATTGPSRTTFLPDVPTMRDAGYRDVEIQEYFAAFVAPRTPTPIVAALAEQIRAAVATKDMQEALTARAFQPSAVSPRELETMVRADHDKWAPIVKSTGFTIEG